MEKHRRYSSAVTPTHNGATATKKERKVSYAGTGIDRYEYVPRSIVNLKEEDVKEEDAKKEEKGELYEEEDPQKRRRRLGIPFEEDFAQKRSKRIEVPCGFGERDRSPLRFWVKGSKSVEVLG